MRADRGYRKATQAKAWAKFPRPFGPKPAPKSDRLPGWRLCGTLGICKKMRVALKERKNRFLAQSSQNSVHFENEGEDLSYQVAVFRPFWSGTHSNIAFPGSAKPPPG